MWRFRRILLLFCLFGFGSVIGGVFVLSQIELDLSRTSADALAQTGYVCGAEVAEGCGPDNALARLNAGEDRDLIAYDQVPLVVVRAIVATEDKDFFFHEGVDVVALGRALYQDIRTQSVAQGGSTITQQYVKNTFTQADRTLARKLREATLAIKLERELTKEQILEAYLNRIYFGRGAYGIQAAARAYFDKDVTELDLADAAFLAGLIRSPGSADPAEDPAEASRRRLTTLVRMTEDGYITEAQAAEAHARSWDDVIPPIDRTGFGDVGGAEVGSEYFVEAVRQQLAMIYPDGQLYTGGLRVYTTLDLELQAAAFASVAEVVDPRIRPDDPSAAIVALDSKGRVLAMMGGYDFDESQVNLTLGRAGGGSGRQPGSSFKPFTLAAAIEEGTSARSLFAAPQSITLPGANNGADWVVRGGGSPSGYRDLIDGLRMSSNVVYAQLMVQLGPEVAVEMANRLGVSAALPAVNSIVLGSGEVSVLDMAAAYSTIANQGVRYAPVLIERVVAADGTTCWYPVGGVCARGGRGRTPTNAEALDPAVARQVTFAMSEVVTSGTGTRAQFGLPAAGKTGTTQDNRDAWFVGFTCDVTAAVWMGYPGASDNGLASMSDFRGQEVHGGDFPADMWSVFMRRVRNTSWGQRQAACESLATQTSFDGEVRNQELSTTTTASETTASETTASTDAAPAAVAPTTPPSDDG